MNSKKESFLDLAGTYTGVELTKKRVMWIVASVVVFAVVMILPLESFGLTSQAKLVLAILLGTLIMYVTECVPSMFTTFLLLVLLVIPGVVSLKEMQTSIGTSPMLMIMALLVVSKGMTGTTLAQRLAYMFIRLVGTSPFKLIVAMITTTALISTVIADIPAAAVMMSIAAGILKEMDEKPGKSQLGKGLMLGIPFASFIGGLGLINGSGINVAGLNILEKITEGAFTVTYNQWAAVGMPFCLIMILPMSMCIYYGYGIQKTKIADGRQLSRDDFAKKLKDLGPMKPSEIRYLITLVVMMILFITSDYTHVDAATTAIIAMLMCIIPGYGCVNWKKAQKEIAWDTLFLIAVGTGLAVAITNTGLATWIADSCLSWCVGYSDFIIIAVILFIGIMSHLVIIGSNSTNSNIMVPIVVPIAIAAGMHPGLAAIAAISGGTASTVMPINSNILIGQPYGYWEYKDLFYMGIPLTFVWTIIGGIVISVVGPMVGLTL